MDSITPTTSRASRPRRATPAANDPRRLSRRRGQVLEEAIYHAVLAELGERGFSRLTYEGVAERASTGKAALYRRWPTKVELVAEALAQALPEPQPIRLSGRLRDDLLAYLEEMAKVLAGPIGSFLRGVIGEIHEHPELLAALRQRAIGPQQDLLREILTSGVERGEVRPEAIAPECIDAGPALIRQRFLEFGPAIPDHVVRAIVDNVLLPMLRPSQG